MSQTQRVVLTEPIPEAAQALEQIGSLEPKDYGLNDRQLKFVLAYMSTLRPLEAYIEAGYAYSQATRQSARKNAHNLLNNPKIQRFIRSRQALLREKLGLRPERIAEEAMRIAFSNIMDYINIEPDGTIKVKERDHIPEEAMAAVQYLEVKTLVNGQQIVKIKLHPKVPALQQLSEISGILGSKRDEDAKKAVSEIHYHIHTVDNKGGITDKPIPLTALPSHKGGGEIPDTQLRDVLPQEAVVDVRPKSEFMEDDAASDE